MEEEKEYRKFIWIRLLLGICITVGLIWAAVYFADLFVPEKEPAATLSADITRTASQEKDSGSARSAEETAEESAESELPETAPEQSAQAQAPDKSQHPAKDQPRGVYFMDQLIEPLEYELSERFWGWRPNDIIKFTDNVNEIQLGVLEVTRRATMNLTERISRSGSAEALDPNLEQAMNWFMVKADSFWFPSAENKYKDAITELRDYQSRLQQGNANFYIRADNLIPLLKALEEILGSCDDNLVKQKERDGSSVSSFHADNYFYYAKGVAKAMDSILRGVEHDFAHTLETRGGADILEHAIHSCHIAAGLDPWLWVTEASLNGILANHRANMAAHVSHARFYISLLTETLST